MVRTDRRLRRDAPARRTRAIDVVVHPPERGQPRPIAAAAACGATSSTTTSSSAHSAGGLIGAAIGARRAVRRAGAESPAHARAARAAAIMYAAVVLVFTVALLTLGQWPWVAMALPVIQLIAVPITQAMCLTLVPAMRP